MGKNRGSTPSTTEIDKVRGLIRRLETDLDNLIDGEREHIHNACAVLRKTRQAVHLGMPTTPAPRIDVRSIGRAE